MNLEKYYSKRCAAIDPTMIYSLKRDFAAIEENLRKYAGLMGLDYDAAWALSNQRTPAALSLARARGFVLHGLRGLVNGDFDVAGSCLMRAGLWHERLQRAVNSGAKKRGQNPRERAIWDALDLALLTYNSNFPNGPAPQAHELWIYLPEDLQLTERGRTYAPRSKETMVSKWRKNRSTQGLSLNSLA